MIFRLFCSFCSWHGKRAATWLGAFGLGATLVTLAPLTADAAMVNYQIGSVAVDINGNDNGLKLYADTSVLDTSVFTLNDSQSKEVSAFRIGTREQSVDLDDVLPKSAKATFFFSLPATVDATVKGISFGVDLLFDKELGIMLFGSPDIIVTQFSTFMVDIAPVHFGVPGSAVVKVKIKQLDSRLPVPEPASTALLVSGGALVLGALRRRRQGATA